MSAGTWIKRLWTGWLIAGLVGMLSACGGGGGGGGATEPSPEPAPSGKVAILFTDGPTDDFTNIWVTIDGISLLGDATSVPVFSGSETFDLLDLKSDSMLLSLESGVPAGTYEKIRLHVTKLELVKPDGTRVYPQLPGNGKIDLNPQSPFQVQPGETLVIELDMDAAKSIHVVETGNGKKDDKYQFRPVVFVDVKSRLPEGKLTRLTGTIVRKSADPTDPWFVLSPGDFSGRVPADPTVTDPRWVKVDVSDKTSIFGEDGHAIPFAALALGDVVTAVGHFLPAPADSGSAPSLAVLDALVVERGVFHRLTGTVVTAPTSSIDTFQFALDPGQGLSGDLQVDAHLFAETKYFWRSGEPAAWSDLVRGMRARLDAVVYLPNSPPATGSNPPSTLQVAMVILEPADDVFKIEGIVQSVNLAGNSLVVKDGSGVEHETLLPDAAHVFLVEKTDSSYSLRAGTQLDVSQGESVTLFGHYEDGRFVVEDVFVAAP